MDISRLYPFDNMILKELLIKASELSGIDYGILQKDLYLTGLLRNILANSPDSDKIYFKGGTALAKCHHIISRFSEDCDIFVYTGNKASSKKQEDKLNGKITHEILDHYSDDITLDENGNRLGKRGGDYNQVMLDFDKAFDNSQFKPYIEFEISSCALRDKSLYTVSSQNMTIQPLIGEILEKAGMKDIVERFGIESFSVQCLSPEKALCDKISRMIRVSYGDNPAEDLSKYIRDTYDIAMFLRGSRFKDFLKSGDFLEKMYVTNLEDRLRANSHAEKPYSRAVIFADPESVFSEPDVKAAYRQIVDEFVFEPENAPSLKDVVETFKSMLPAMQRFEKYRMEQDGGMGGAGGSGGIGAPGHKNKIPPEDKQENTVSDTISNRDKAALSSIGVNDVGIDKLEATGRLEINTYNYRPARSWDGNIPQIKNKLRFSFHDGSVFILTPDQKQEIPLRQAIVNVEAMAAFIHKPDVSLKHGLELKDNGPKLKR